MDVWARIGHSEAGVRSSVRTLARALSPSHRDTSRDERDAVNALALHLLWRFEQGEFEPLDEDGRTFLTVSHTQRVRYRQLRLVCHTRRRRLPDPG